MVLPDRGSPCRLNAKKGGNNAPFKRTALVCSQDFGRGSEKPDPLDKGVKGRLPGGSYLTALDKDK